MGDLLFKNNYMATRQGSCIQVKIKKGVVMKTELEGFLTSCTSTNQLKEEIIQAWQQESRFLSKWINKFNLANVSNDDNLSSSRNFSVTDLQQRQASLSKTLVFPTSGGSKRKFKKKGSPFTPQNKCL